tara:strand:+ start:764 stop:1036 length:273 start_codon:yes stop_codon:yes gene_type:complete
MTEDTITQLLMEEAYDLFTECMENQLKLCEEMIAQGKELDNEVDQLFGKYLAILFTKAQTAGIRYQVEELKDQVEQLKAQNPEPEIAVAS